MTNTIKWLRQNWLVAILVLVILYLLTDGAGIKGNAAIYDAVAPSATKMGVSLRSSTDYFMPEAAPVAQSERMMVQDTDVSLLANDIDSTIKAIEKNVVALGGYMVNKYLNQPEGAATGYITVRVPIEKRETALEDIRKIGVKVVSENVNGNDVTDQYVDLEERIGQLEKTKNKMQAIMDQAVNVSDLVNIQSQLTNIQTQIDNNKGQQKYLEQTAKLTRITVNLSTDELALPYTPDEAWRPQAVFKNAVRAVIQAMRLLASAVIWLAVFAPMVGGLVLSAWLAKTVYERVRKIT